MGATREMIRTCYTCKFCDQECADVPAGTGCTTDCARAAWGEYPDWTPKDEAVDGSNPKDLIGNTKPDYQNVPLGPLYEIGKALLDGTRKYGRFNWRDQPVSANVYINAARRHLDKWAAKEELADDSKVHHLAHAAACLMILIDAQAHDSLKDDRVADAYVIRASSK
ncbi:dATP/dGTP diphosphohydrolase domain-containing protein [Paracoccus sp. (in: a-proteobacteria)]|uniref:dATP/dGTP diphosphohydrolase domain-containing protein n=1 Tax=Paracoccus sp. TaxID=267 RepID=UPI0026E009B7|nr:dATP/dGTP diphosphohydrolase domain-containing protein [Paracoccus sp. (in: a-proteobacteria)]MDO5647356.1 DUF5664 domain-containing protein [Paracoccus sp. (in: a-proteobacteria)]